MDEASLDVINNDCLLHILQKLSLKERIKVERVNKRWLQLSRTLWRSTYELHVGEFSIKSDNSFNISLPRALQPLLMRCGSNLRSLTLRPKYHNGFTNMLDLINTYCESLMYLDYSDLDITPSEVDVFCTKFNSLRELHLSSVPLDDNSLAKIYIANPNLHFVKLHHIYKISNGSFDKLGKKTEIIIIEICQNINSEQLINSLKNLNNLKKLFIDSSCDTIDIKHLVEAVPQLEDLSLQWFKTIQNMPLLGKLKNLRLLSLKDDYIINDATLEALVEGCPLLHTLNISYCDEYGNPALTSDGIKNLVHLPQLKVLKMTKLSQVNDEVLQVLATSGKLTHVWLRECFQISDDGVKILLELCPHLEELILRYCRKITKATIDKAIQVTRTRPIKPHLNIDIWSTEVDMGYLPDTENTCLQIVY